MTHSSAVSTQRILLAVLSTLLYFTGAHAQPTALTARAPDAFYEPPPGAPRKPGTLLRSEPLKDVILPVGMQGWKILYATSVDDRTPATAVATVFAPSELPPGPRPVITWVHGTTGLVQRCMPSLVSSPTEGIPARDAIVKAGWVIVATDYQFVEKGGPHPYLIGEGEARAALDSVRAARQMPELMIDARTVVWGHSQGGHSALWTGNVGPRYAPEISIVGVAAIAPAANMMDLLRRSPTIDKRLGPYIARAYGRFYPDITFERAIRPVALEAAREIEGLCGFVPLSDPQRIAALTAGFEGRALELDKNKALATRLAENTANRPIAAPLLVAQGLADVVVLPAATDAWVKERCAAGQRLEYWTVPGRDHGTVVRPGTPIEEGLVAWTADRFSGKPQTTKCAPRTVVQTPVPVNVDNFIRAETDMYFAGTVAEGGFGKFVHNRSTTPIDKQKVIRMNRDTLYSSAVFDLDAGPVTITLPDSGPRFMSLMVLDEDHYILEVAYKPGRYTYSKGATRYILAAVRILADDLNAAHALQDQIKVEQAAPGSFEVPNWDRKTQDEARAALLSLSGLSGLSGEGFGKRGSVDPVKRLLGAAAGWGGNPKQDASYLGVTPKANDGKTVYRLVVRDVPVDAFWSISVYNAKGFFEKNALDAYSLNNLTAKPGKDGTYTIQFGGCDGKVPNCLPITKGWNYTVRLYRPRAEILEGRWKFPEAQAITRP